MRLLLDTRAFIWMATDPDRLSRPAATAIADADNDVCLSAATGWEIAVERARGRLRFPDVDRRMVVQLRLTELPIDLAHAAAVGRLPDHHRDPFDRMLVAQAGVEAHHRVTRPGAGALRRIGALLRIGAPARPGRRR